MIDAMVHRIDTGKWDNITSPENMNAVGRAFGLGEPRFTDPGVAVEWSGPSPYFSH